MKISLQEETQKPGTTTIKIEDRDLTIGLVRGRHVVQISKAYKNADEVEKAYLLLALLSRENDVNDCWSVEELMDVPLSLIKPALDLLA